MTRYVISKPGTGAYKHRTPLHERSVEFTLGFLILAYTLLDRDSFIRDSIPVILPALAIFILLAFKSRNRINSRVNPKGIFLVGSWTLLCFLSLFQLDFVDEFTVKKFLIPLSGLAWAAIRLPISYSFLVRMTCFFIVIGLLSTISVVANVDQFSDRLIASTSSRYESYLGILLSGISVIFILHFKSVRWFAVSIVFAYIFYKRMALASALITIFLFVLPQLLSLSTKLYRHYHFILGSMSALLLLGFSTFLVELFDLAASSISGLTAERLSTGRVIIYRSLGLHMSQSDFLANLIGHGAGFTERLISLTPEIGLANLAHNEFFSVYIDFGLIGLILFFGSICLIPQSTTGRSLIIFLFILGLLENFLFLPFVLGPIMLIAANLETSDRGKVTR